MIRKKFCKLNHMLPTSPQSSQMPEIPLGESSQKPDIPVQPLSIQKLKMNRVYRLIIQYGNRLHLESSTEDLSKRDLREIVESIVEIYNKIYTRAALKRKRDSEIESEIESDSGSKKTKRTEIDPSKPKSPQTTTNKKKRKAVDSVEGDEAKRTKGSSDDNESDSNIENDPETTEVLAIDPNREIAAQFHEPFELQEDFHLEDVNYQIVEYTRKINFHTKMEKVSKEKGAKGLLPHSGQDFLLFFYRENPKEIFAITTGSASEVTKDCADYKFPLKVTKGLLNSKKLIKVKRLDLIGTNRSELLENPDGHEFYKIDSIYYFVQHFVCQVKEACSLMKLPFFKKGAYPFITVRKYLFRIEKPLRLSQYPSLLDFFSKREQAINNGLIEEQEDPLFELLNHIQLVELEKKQGLTYQLLKVIFEKYQQNRDQKIYFQPPQQDLDKFLNAESFEIILGDLEVSRILNSYPSLNEVIKIIIQVKSPLNVEEFITAFKGGIIKFGSNQAKFMDCLQGELLYKGKAYFKIGKAWYRFSVDHHALLQEDFKRLLIEALFDPKKEKHKLLPHSWAGNSAPNLLKDDSLKEKLGISSRELINLLKNSKVCFIEFPEVKQKRLFGEILHNKVIQKHSDRINQLLTENSSISAETFKRDFDKDADVIMQELEKPRTITSGDGTIINRYAELLKEHEFVANCFKEFKAYLEDESHSSIPQKGLGKLIGKESGKGNDDFIKALKTTTFSFITSARIHAKSLCGEILSEELIKQNKDLIEQKILSQDTPPDENQLKMLFPGKGQAERIKELLSCQRSILNSSGYVTNPLAYPFKDDGILRERFKEFQTFLEEASQKAQEAEQEGDYNRSYLHTQSNNNVPYDAQKGYLVFDKVCPLNLEPADIIKYDEHEILLYHVKEEFGQKTREACSQIINAAQAFRSALSLHQAKNYLELLWQQGTNYNDLNGADKSFRLALKEQLEHLGQETFFKLFHERKIVFVYAFLKPSDAKSLYHEKNIKTMLKPQDFQELRNVKIDPETIYRLLQKLGFLDSLGRLSGKFYSTNFNRFKMEVAEWGWEENQIKTIHELLSNFKSLSGSTLAKLELIRTAKEVKNLGFEFRICEIEKKGRGSTATQDSGEYEYLSYSPNDPAEGTQSDSFSSQSILIIRNKRYQICKTLSDNVSGLHALLGTCDQGIYRTKDDPRKDFSNRIREALIANPRDQEIWKLYEMILRKLLTKILKKQESTRTKELFEQLGDETSPLHQLYKKYQQCRDDNTAKIQKKKDSCFATFKAALFPEKKKGEQKKPESHANFIKILKESNQEFISLSNESFIELMKDGKNERKLRQAFEKSLDKIIQCSGSFLKQKFLEEAKNIKTWEEDIEKAFHSFISNEKIIDHYCTTIAKESYLLRTEEMAMAAHIFNKHLLLVSRKFHPQGNEDHSYEYNKDGEELIIVYKDKKHYRRGIECVETPEEPEEDLLKQLVLSSNEHDTNQIHQLLSAELKTELLSSSAYTGIINKGTDCFLIAALQLIFNTPLIDYLELDESQELKRLLLSTLYKYRLSAKDKSVANLPLGSLRRVLGFSVAEQEDVSEVFNRLINQLDIEPIQSRIEERSCVDLKARRETEDPNYRDLTRAREKCSRVNDGGLVVNTFTTPQLLLDLIPGEINNVQHLINKYFEAIVIPQDIHYIFQDKAFLFTKRTSKQKIIDFKDFIFVLIKRFSESSSGDYEKNNTVVDLETDVVSISDQGFNLVAFIEHRGQTLKGGHYVLFLKKENSWCCFNDSVVVDCTPEQIRESRKKAYLFLFEKEQKASDSSIEEGSFPSNKESFEEEEPSASPQI